MSWRTEDGFPGLELLLDFAKWPTVHHSYVVPRPATRAPDKYTIQIGSSFGRQIGNAEKVHSHGPYGGLRLKFRFTPLEETRELFPEAPMDCPTLKRLKAAVGGVLRARSRALADELRALADEMAS